MTNIDKEKVLAHLHLMQKDIEQIKRIISGSEIIEIKEPPLPPQPHPMPPPRIPTPRPTPQPPTLPPQTPIGVLVRSRLKNTLEQRQWSEQEFYNFFDKSYSKIMFDINYPLLSFEIFVAGRNGKARVRYYKDSVFVNGKECYLCSQWYEGSRTMVLDFLKQYENL